MLATAQNTLVLHVRILVIVVAVSRTAGPSHDLFRILRLDGFARFIPAATLGEETA